MVKKNRWTEVETQLLSELWPSVGAACAESFPRRTPVGIQLKARLMGLPFKPQWSETEDKILHDHYERLGPKWCSKLLPLRSYKAVQSRAAFLELKSSTNLSMVDGESSCSSCGERHNRGRTLCLSCSNGRVSQMRLKRKRVREFLFTHFGGQCVDCGEVDRRVLTLDHPDMDGADDRRGAGGRRISGTEWYGKVYASLSKGLAWRCRLELRCFNCHARKDVCPWWLREEAINGI